MNKTLALSITILLFVIQKIPAQNYLDYYKTINKAEIANLDENFKKSDSLYQIAFRLVEKPFKDDYLSASINSEKLNNNQQSYEYLKNGILAGLTKKMIKKSLSTFKKSKKWKELKKEYESIREQYLNSLDLRLREELIKMVAKDQAVRHPVFGSTKKMKKADNENYKHLLKIIEQNNGEWPGRFTIGDGNENGKYAFGEITIMLHHFSEEEVNNLKPILISAILKGDLSPYNVAYPLDYINPQKIGERKRRNSIIIYNCYVLGSYRKSSNKEITICDCEKAETEREKMGLEPLDDYFRKINSSYECYEQDKN
ncbi:hypothetical protein MQE36_08305 [Zhouia spongiae]|uniref:GLPGLI family protein n=1 Tax=Zhouia spongiae TaxID=2202721 RepID=A0ABY3YSA9_9FLAO|nr:hypothetical protein [Zhouia spongiae]UNZ00327.1 hypothetical protein MQE36_08305 [Zhouia spongiae]